MVESKNSDTVHSPIVTYA
ncbi:hypothetical protein A2U01_0118513, partial [Trifolium medium]|nr:hypothetical protein [Trifolium medium]